MSETDDTISKEDQAAIEKDIADAKSNLVSKATEDAIQKAKTEAKEEAKKEIEEANKMAELQKQNEELAKQLEAKEKQFSESFDQLKGKVDEMVSSKAQVKVEDPFAKAPPAEANQQLDKMTDDQLSEVEKESGRAFLGPEFDDKY